MPFPYQERASDVKTGIPQQGGVPIEMPAISLAEVFQKPSTMMYRNLLALETEELLRSYPIDGCVLMGGCDKTTPGLLMGAISMNLPTIFVPAGAMLRGHWRGQTLGSGSIFGNIGMSFVEATYQKETGKKCRGHCTLSGNVYDHGNRFDYDVDSGSHGF